MLILFPISSLAYTMYPKSYVLDNSDAGDVRFKPNPKVSKVLHVQWNLDFTIRQGDSKIILLNWDIVVNELLIYK